jgi:DNA-binding beta-propeller fold protein YncE
VTHLRSFARALPFAFFLAGCHDKPAAPPAGAEPSAAADVGAVASATASASAGADAGVLVARPLPLPGATGAVSLDYIAYDATHRRLWVPAGNTASVDVLDSGTQTFTRIEGFPTVERDFQGKKRTLGASAATIGDASSVYIGSRGASNVCVVDAQSMKLGSCLALADAPDGLSYVASAKELWVTVPSKQTLVVLDVSTAATPKMKTSIKLEGQPEGFGVDDTHGVFYTNLEDKDRTLAIDVKTHKVKSTWKPDCGQEGPRGLALDVPRGLLMVACTDGVRVLDLAHDGAVLARLATGAGVDNLDYLAEGHLLYVAAGKVAKLLVVRVEDNGAMSVTRTVPTSEGARNAVVDAAGNAYVADGPKGRILFVAKE